MAKIEIPESWAGVVGRLRALLAEVEREVDADDTVPPELTACWAQVSDAIRATVRAKRTDAQAAAAEARMSKR